MVIKLINKRNIVIAAAVITVCIVLLLTVTQKSAGYSDKAKNCQYVMVENGDSLWSIASEYYTLECGDMDDYINEIIESNGLKSDIILEGKYLLVPYYE